MSDTIKKSNSSSKKQGRIPKSKALDRPFEDSVLRRAKKIVKDYSIVVKEDDELEYIGSALEMPTVFADGKTANQCYEATRQALMVAAATMIECGRKPPTSGKKRSIQVNIRLTPEEKMLMTNASTDLGFRGISDFIRNCALAAVRRA